MAECEGESSIIQQYVITDDGKIMLKKENEQGAKDCVVGIEDHYISKVQRYGTAIAPLTKNASNSAPQNAIKMTSDATFWESEEN